MANAYTHSAFSGSVELTWSRYFWRISLTVTFFGRRTSYRDTMYVIILSHDRVPRCVTGCPSAQPKIDDNRLLYGAILLHNLASLRLSCCAPRQDCCPPGQDWGCPAAHAGKLEAVLLHTQASLRLSYCPPGQDWGCPAAHLGKLRLCCTPGQAWGCPAEHPGKTEAVLLPNRARWGCPITQQDNIRRLACCNTSHPSHKKARVRLFIAQLGKIEAALLHNKNIEAMSTCHLQEISYLRPLLPLSINFGTLFWRSRPPLFNYGVGHTTQLCNNWPSCYVMVQPVMQPSDRWASIIIIYLT